MKLNVILAKTDHLASSFRAMISDYISFFKNNQGDFKGIKKTYVPKEGTIDLPTEREDKKVVTTVDEKLAWMIDTSKEYVDSLFAQEATNASGTAKAALIVNGQSWGEFTSLELLRLKSFLENGDFEKMLQNIPVRSDSEIWNPTSNEMYKDRRVYEQPMTSGIKKSTVKESFIMPDPNITRDTGARYTPQIGQKDAILELGDYTTQKFSGEWSHRERAELLRKRSVLLTAVIEALKVSNEVEVVKSELTAERIFGYLLG
jgi:hypothetical protein